jgi:hypothetical protein
MGSQYALTLALDELKGALGERWAGAWIETHEPLPTACVGVVAPDAKDILRVHRSLRAVGWYGSTVACRYSERELDELLERVHDALVSPTSEMSLLSIVPDRSRNKLHVELSVEEETLVEGLLAAVPSDALRISIRPGWSYVAYATQETHP